MTAARDPGRVRLLAAMRIGWAPLWLVQLVIWGQDLWLADAMPRDAWSPFGLGHFMAPPTGLAVFVVWLVALASTVLVGIGLWTRVAGSVALASGVLLGTAVMGWSKIGHGSQPLLLFLLVFSFTPWGAAWSLDARRNPGRPLPATSDAPYVVTMVLTGLLYFSSGLLKVARGEFLQPGNLAGFISRQNIRYADWYDFPTPDWSLALAGWVVDHPPLADLMGWGALALEFGIIVGALGPRFRLLACALVLVLQGGIGILAPLRFYTQAHVALLLGFATLVVLRRHDVAWMARWFPQPAAGEAPDPDAGLWTSWTFALHAAVLAVLLVAMRLLQGEVPADLDAATLWASPFIAYTLFSAEMMLLLLAVGTAAALWVAADLARLAWAQVRRPVADGRRRVLLYDADCGFCQSWVDWSRARGPVGVDFRTCQESPDVRAAGGITMANCSEAAYLVTFGPDGRAEAVDRGARAINGVLGRLAGRGSGLWRFLAGFYRLDGVRQAQDVGYVLVARNRHRLGDSSCPVPGQPGQPGQPPA